MRVIREYLNKMEIYTMFTDWKTQYYKDVSSLTVYL